MKNPKTILLIIIYATLAMACSGNKEAKKKALSEPWWTPIQPIVIGDAEFYGRTCYVIRVTRDEAGVESAWRIFEAPSRMFTYCAKSDPATNYLKYDGEYIILQVHRQTAGAGSSTGERYRSADFKSWEEYIGVTWVNSEEYEAWRRVGSTSSKADSIKKVVKGDAE